MTAPLLEVSGLSKSFRRSGEHFPAVSDVSFTVAPGEAVALVGPSGSGKSTVARLLLRLVEPASGAVRFAGENWLALRGSALRRRRPLMQAVFQDPLAAFNPRATVGSAVAEPLRIGRLASGAERPSVVAGLLARVGLDPALASRPIHAVSGGQRQRVAIARALAAEPELIICDEITSALDQIVQAGILRMLDGLQSRLGVSYLFITHDLEIVKSIANRVLVIGGGEILDHGPRSEVMGAPRHPYTRLLLDSVPQMSPGWLDAFVAQRHAGENGDRPQ